MTTMRVDLSSDMRRRAGVGPDDVAPEHQQPAGTQDADAENRRLVAMERQRAVEVVRACQLAGRPDLAGQYIDSGKSVGEVVQALNNTRGAARRLGRA